MLTDNMTPEYGDVTHEDWCPTDDPQACGGSCNSRPTY